MTPLAWACIYLLGAIITYGVCWNWMQTDRARTELDITPERERAYQAFSVGICAVAAAFWPATAVVAAIDALQNRSQHRRTPDIDVGQTITIDGKPMRIISISQREGDNLETAVIHCAGPRNTEGGTQ